MIDTARRRVRLDPRDPKFFGDPYPAYRAIRAATPVFFCEDYGFWCFARHADVSALCSSLLRPLESEPPANRKTPALVDQPEAA